MLNKNSFLKVALLIMILSEACLKPKKPDKTVWPKDTVMYDVAYGPHPRHKYDLYLPAGRDTIKTPGVLLLHGGGWKYGQKEDMQMWVNLFRKVYPEAAIINMNYRLASWSEGIHHPEIMTDLQEAVQHIMAHRAEYRIAGRMAMAGESAGAHLSMMYAYRFNEAGLIRAVGDLYGPSTLYDWSWYSSANLWLGALVGDVLAEYVGAPFDSAAYCAASPYWQATSQAPPTIIFHGILDPIVPKYQSDWLNARLHSLGVPRQYHEVLAFHGFNYYQAEDAVQKMTAFFRPLLKP